MSKSNVNPNHYKVAGRGRQGEDIAQTRNTQKHAESVARLRTETNGKSQNTTPQPGTASPGAAPRLAPKQAPKKARVKRSPPHDKLGTLPVKGAVVGAVGRAVRRRRPPPTI